MECNNNNNNNNGNDDDDDDDDNTISLLFHQDDDDNDDDDDDDDDDERPNSRTHNTHPRAHVINTKTHSRTHARGRQGRNETKLIIIIITCAAVGGSVLSPADAASDRKNANRSRSTRTSLAPLARADASSSAACA